MREIKFRVWDRRLNKYLNRATDIRLNIGNGEVHGMMSTGNVPEWTLEQFTGLLDKNGKKIYEGDIIMMDEEAVVSPNEAVVIEYDFGVPLSHPVDSRFYNTNCIHELCVDRLGNSKPRHGVAGIILGNIHEATK